MSTLRLSGLKRGPALLLAALAGFALLPGENLIAGPTVGVGELSAILADHIPPPLPPNAELQLNTFARKVRLEVNSAPAKFMIPGFDHFGCARCHTADQLIDKAVSRQRDVAKTLRHDYPAIKTIPLRQYIIQPYADELLTANQFAHATFDTVRIFPRSIIVDEKVYKRSTHLHETFHLTQPFVGYANELSAYAINIRADPRFALMNFPYFADVMSAFFLPQMDGILEKYFSGEVKGDSRVPAQAQRFINSSGQRALGLAADSIKKMRPLLREVYHLNRKYPLQAAYQTSRTMTLSLLLDIAAVKLLPMPPANVPEPVQRQAMREISAQMEKNDNTRLGYVIDRKKESLLNLKYKLGIKSIADRRALYFLYIKTRYLKKGSVFLTAADHDDFQRYVRKKLDDVEKMLKSKRITPIEKSAGKKMAEKIKKELLQDPMF